VIEVGMRIGVGYGTGRVQSICNGSRPMARRGVSSGVVVQLLIRNLQVVWRATVVRCIAAVPDRPMSRAFGDLG